MSPMRRSRRCLSLPCVLLVGWAIATTALGALAVVQTHALVAGTRVSVRVPAGFERAAGIEGFRDVQTGSTLIVMTNNAVFCLRIMFPRLPQMVGQNGLTGRTETI